MCFLVPARLDRYGPAIEGLEDRTLPAVLSPLAFIHGGQIGLELAQDKEEGRLRDTWSPRRVQEALLR